jgi:hypothetical protein
LNASLCDISGCLALKPVSLSFMKTLYADGARLVFSSLAVNGVITMWFEGRGYKYTPGLAVFALAVLVAPLVDVSG